MVVVNLSEEYRQNNNLSMMERIRLYFDIDVYSASSFQDIENHFDNNPLRKRGAFGLPSAIVIMEDVGVRKFSNDYSFDDTNPEHLKSLDNAEHFPAFQIDDTVDTRVAFFGATASDYLDYIEQYGITNDSHVRIPKLYLQYTELKPSRLIMIKSFGSVESEAKENLLEKIVRKNDVVGLAR